jgi:hypothetical protein
MEEGGVCSVCHINEASCGPLVNNKKNEKT